MSDTDGTMQSQDPKDRLMLIIKGVTVLAALTLIPESITSEDDGDQFTSQIVYAFSTNVEGILDPLRDSRVFAFVAFAVIVYSPYVRVMLRGTPYNSRVVLSICDVANLVFFDAFTGVAFVETGDPFGDIAVILGVFGLLWNFHGVSSDLQGIQQFTTWRTATFISKIFNEVGLNDLTLATLVFTTVSILTHTPQLTRSVPWVTDLLFLIGLSGFISYVTRMPSRSTIHPEATQRPCIMQFPETWTSQTRPVDPDAPNKRKRRNKVKAAVPSPTSATPSAAGGVLMLEDDDDVTPPKRVCLDPALVSPDQSARGHVSLDQRLDNQKAHNKNTAVEHVFKPVGVTVTTDVDT
ncbi:hypothetical protein T484DRAFT_1758399, partial [Baffinella frigidus]